MTSETSAHARTETSDLTLRPLVKDDGARVWQLARDTGMDLNSPYAYVLWGEHFSATSIVAETDGEVVGYVTGYRLPDDPATVFVWQVAVDPKSRQGGLASRMLDELVARLPAVTAMEATITPTNQASARLFTAFAERHGASVTTEPVFGSELFPEGGHEPEDLFRIEPLKRTNAKAQRPHGHMHMHMQSTTPGT